MEQPIHFHHAGKRFRFVETGAEYDEQCKACAFDDDHDACTLSDKVRSCVKGVTGHWVADPEQTELGLWIDWSGGECPVRPDTVVEFKLRGGHKGVGAASNLEWHHSGSIVDDGADVVAYRVVQPAEDDHEMLTFHPLPDSGSKPTNPKDAIGIRKAPLSCVPMGVVAEAGVAMLEGASKYGRHNFRAVGVRGSVYFDATMRHLVSYWEGEDIDPDSGLSHLTKAIVSLMVWRDAEMQGMLTDDRPPRSVPFYRDLNDKVAAVLDRHADKNPRHYTIEDSQ